MSAVLDESARAFLDGEPEFAVIATIQPDGRPQQTPVWIKREGDQVLFSTTRGRRKELNLQRDPRVGVLVLPRDDPYSYLEIRGTATIEDDPGGALIEELSQRYTGKPWTEPTPAERVVVRITPERVRAAVA